MVSRSDEGLSGVGMGPVGGDIVFFFIYIFVLFYVF